MILSARSACDYESTFHLEVIERKGNWATIKYDGKTRRTKIRKDSEGREYLMPERYSMAPMFYPPKHYIHGGNAYRLEDGVLFTAAVLISGEVDDDWCEVMEIEEDAMKEIRKALEQ